MILKENFTTKKKFIKESHMNQFLLKKYSKKEMEKYYKNFKIDWQYKILN
jgi:hypothetical protein